MDPVIHLLHACDAGDLTTVKEMIERKRVDVNATFFFRIHHDSDAYNIELLDATPLLLAVEWSTRDELDQLTFHLFYSNFKRLFTRFFIRGNNFDHGS